MQVKKYLLRLILFGMDIFLFVASYVFAYLIRFRYMSDGIVNVDYGILLSVIVLLYTGIIAFVKWQHYLKPINNAGYIYLIFKTHIYLFFCLFAFLFAFKSNIDLSRLHILISLITSFLLCSTMGVGFRRYLFSLVKRSDSGEKVILICNKADMKEILSNMSAKENWYYQVSGVAILDAESGDKYIQNIPVISYRDDLLHHVLKAETDAVFVYGDSDCTEQNRDVIEGLISAGITTYMYISEARYAEGDGYAERIGAYPVWTYSRKQNIKLYIVKRAADIVVGAIGSAFYLATWLPIALLVRLCSKGPVLVPYIKVGRNGKRFRLLKYRTLGGEKGESQNLAGKILVHTKLENLPMFLLLLHGELSLFGKRALSLQEFLDCDANQRKNMGTKPGLIQTWFCDDEYDREQEIYIEDWWLNKCPVEIVDKPAEKKCLYHILKRFMDIVISLVGIVLLCPVYIVILLAVFLFDGHSPIYAQMRVGKHGRKINIYKFRTMHHLAGDLERLLTPEQLDRYKREYKLDDDPRVTKIGNILRKTSLDELPQLFNVLKGDISLVGPRPVVEAELVYYGNQVSKLLSVKPGLTGYWQAYRRNLAKYESGERQEMELSYVDRESLWFDIKIVVKTVATVISGKGCM